MATGTKIKISKEQNRKTSICLFKPFMHLNKNKKRAPGVPPVGCRPRSTCHCKVIQRSGCWSSYKRKNISFVNAFIHKMQFYSNRCDASSWIDRKAKWIKGPRSQPNNPYCYNLRVDSQVLAGLLKPRRWPARLCGPNTDSNLKR